MLSHSRSSGCNEAYLTFEPTLLRSIKKVRVEVKIDPVTRDCQPYEDSEEFLVEQEERIARLQEHVRTVSLKLRREAQLEELEIYWIHCAGPRCADCRKWHFVKSCLSCYHKATFKHEAEGVQRILEHLKYATTQGKVRVFSGEFYHKYEGLGKAIKKGPPKKEDHDVLRMLFPSSPSEPETIEQEFKAELKAWHAAEAPKVAYARQIQDTSSATPRAR